MIPVSRRSATRSRRRVWVYVLPVFLACATVLAQDKVDTFRLQTMDRRRAYGPFELGSGNRVFIGDHAYTLQMDAGKKIKFKSSTGEVFGPFDFVVGRIVELGGANYTLIDIRKIAAPKRDEQEPAAPAVPPRPVAPVKPVQPVRPTARPPQAAPPRTAERKEGSIGVGVSLVDIVLYDADIGGVLSKSDTTIERQSLSLSFDRGPINLQAGLTANGEWSESASEPGLGFEDARLLDGKGWWLSARYSHAVYRDREWQVDVYGEGSYLTEDYSLEYGQWISALVYQPGTNGTGTLESVVEFRESRNDVTLSEWGIRLGAGISYDSVNWWCYGNLEAIALSDTKVDGGIVVGEQTYAIELDRSFPLSAVGGLGLKLADWRLFVEGRAGADRRVHFGAAYALW